MAPEMSTTTTALDAPSRGPRALIREGARRVSWAAVGLAGVVAVAAFLRLYDLGQNGYANEYYAAAVKSMLTGWHDFFFVSFDAGGFVSVDKPPLGLWTQAAFAKAFGFSGTNVILPQALAGTASVVVLYALVRRSFAPAAALLAAFALAVAPVSVAVDRDNMLEPLLVLTLLLAAWCCLRATESGRVSWALLTGLLLGLAFEIKTMQALIVLTVFALVFLWGADLSWPRRALHLALATLVLVPVALVWAVAVDLTPEDSRPWVGGSESNSAFDLMLGYNGLGRLSGGDNNTITLGGPGAPSFNPSLFDGGTPGALRLFDERLAAQVMWLLPLAAAGVLAAWRGPLLSRLDPARQQLVLWSGWIAVHVAVFSYAEGIFHGYYVALIAPAIAALVGIGLIAMWQRYREGGWRGWLLPAALLATGAFQLYVLSDFRSWNGWLSVLCGAGAVSAALVLALGKLRPDWWRVSLVAAGAGVVALFAAPIAWAVSPLLGPGNGVFPMAGPVQVVDFGSSSPTGAALGLPPNTLRFLLDNQGDTTFLVAVSDARTAAPLILQTGEPVMATGGFVGSDPILTPEKLDRLVAGNDIRFFRILPFGLDPDVQAWLTANCAVVDPANATNPLPRPSFNTLLDCAPDNDAG
jgi:4-amino-4-deoxy-L-arabinose transferase-like glycosyltransferase